MHAPDGFLDPSVAAAMAIVAVIVLGKALRASEVELGDRRVPLAGVCAAFIFGAQMVNFPVASGTTGHLLGGALAAILLGPWVGSLVVAIVVVVQALVFADGGLTALGYNTVNMAVVPAFAGWALFRGFRRLLPRNVGGVVGAGALAAGVSVVLSAMAFSLQWLFGATAPVAFDTVFGAMVGVHVLIGVGEAVITGLVVAAVMASRPDLVVGAADLSPTQLAGQPRVANRTFAIGAVLVALVLATAISQFAASPSAWGWPRPNAGFEPHPRPDHEQLNSIRSPTSACPWHEPDSPACTRGQTPRAARLRRHRGDHAPSVGDRVRR
ncbi:MAG: hypothetical protein EBY65_06710 [Acidimicrobiia bacterium]|nr:hypothetical protein [Acidimicrobiia bacterium]